jgi:hypothetical protein
MPSPGRAPERRMACPNGTQQREGQHQTAQGGTGITARQGDVDSGGLVFQTGEDRFYLCQRDTLERYAESQECLVRVPSHGSNIADVHRNGFPSQLAKATPLPFEMDALQQHVRRDQHLPRRHHVQNGSVVPYAEPRPRR